MGIVALDATKLTVLMVAGGLFALAGLWMLFRPQTPGDGTRIEIFGLKVQASSVGFLVFVVGAAFLALPVIVPEKPAADTASVSGSLAGTPNRAAGSTLAELPLPQRAGSSEVEPNDTISDSNALAVGQTVHGKLAPGDLDWYVFATDPSTAEKLRVTFRTLAEDSACPQYFLLDARENQVNYEQVCAGEVSLTKSYFIDSDRYYIRVDARGSRSDYEIAIAYE